jgi:hypothetical protein
MTSKLLAAMLHVLGWVLPALWTPTVLAATAISLQSNSQPLVLDATLVTISIVITFLAGLTTLFIRINAHLGADPDAKLVRPFLFCSAHLLGSLLAGVAAFLMGLSNGWSSGQTLVAVLLLAFGGAAGLERIVERYLAIMPIPGGTKPPPDASDRRGT